MLFLNLLLAAAIGSLTSEAEAGSSKYTLAQAAAAKWRAWEALDFGGGHPGGGDGPMVACSMACEDSHNAFGWCNAFAARDNGTCDLGSLRPEALDPLVEEPTPIEATKIYYNHERSRGMSWQSNLGLIFKGGGVLGSDREPWSTVRGNHLGKCPLKTSENALFIVFYAIFRSKFEGKHDFLGLLGGLVDLRSSQGAPPPSTHLWRQAYLCKGGVGGHPPTCTPQNQHPSSP